MTSNHQSDSAVQREAEKAIVHALAARLNVPLKPGGTLQVGDGVNVRLDAVSEDGQVAVEAYARQGVLKGGQLKKIAQDVLKFALLRRLPGFQSARLIVVFASEEARDSITGWVRHAAEEFDVELEVVEISNEVRERIVAAQDRQKMVNIPVADAVGDLTIDE